MELTSILIGMLLFAVIAYIIYQPFREKKRTGTKRRKTGTSPKVQREAVLSALRDLDFDFKTGKVTEEDYVPLRAQLMEEAARSMERVSEEEDKFEALIESRRRTLQKGPTCGTCGTALEDGQRYCAKCGSAVQEESCPSCGRKIRLGDQFCSSCGTKIESLVEAAAS